MSYNTSVQLGGTAFLVCKVAPDIESVSKLSYRILFYVSLCVYETKKIYR
jgi:hypothetical protein